MKLVSNKRLLYIDDDISVYCHKGKMFIYTENIQKSIKLPMNLLQHFLVKMRLIERMIRLEPRFAYRIGESQIIFSFHGGMYFLDWKSREIRQELKYNRGMNNPLTISISTMRDGRKRYLIGEYIWNVEKGEVNIYERNKDGSWEVIYTFPSKTITHIHQIVYDKYKDCYLIATGDLDSESAIWMADIGFKHVSPILKGKQVYRSCFIVPTENGFYYATDTPIEKNAIYNVVLDDKQPVITEILDMPGPCIYGKIIAEDKVLMATSVEPDSTLPAWRYRITRKLGKGVSDSYSYLILGTSDGEFKTIEKAKKDKHMMWLFQFGNFYFPEGNSDRMLVTGIALDGYDGKTIEV